MQLKFHILDVFTDKPFGGNPLAVVHGGDALPSSDMQRIAREFNLSETVFVLATDKPAHSARLRIFTPLRELPFAGHPTVGAAALIAQLKTPDPATEHDHLVILEEDIGTVRVGVRQRPGLAAFAEFDAPKLPAQAGVLPPVDKIAAALGLIPSEIGFENHKPTCFAVGTAFAFVPIASLDAIARADINSLHWAEAFDDQGLAGVYIYTRQCQHTTSSFHVRMFAPALGIREDSATGSAAVCFAGVVQHFDGLTDGHHRRIIEQGYEMGRPSAITLTLAVDAGRLTNIRIGGHVVRVAEGVMEV